MNWAEILADKAKYPDDLKMTINGQEVTLGAIRTQNAASQGDIERKLTERQQQLDHVAREQQSATDNLAKIVENVMKVTGLSVEQIVTGQIPENLRKTVQQATLATTTAAGVPLAEDPLYAPVMKELEPMRSDVNLVKTGLGQALNIYKNDRARLDYLEYIALRKPSGEFKVTLDDALKTAVTKGYKNSEGWPDVTRALDELAAPIAAKQTEQQLKEKYIEEGRKQRDAELAGTMGQPTFGGGPTTSAGGVDFSGAPEPAGHKVLSIREQLNKAFNDPQMLATATVQ